MLGQMVRYLCRFGAQKSNELAIKAAIKMLERECKVTLERLRETLLGGSKMQAFLLPEIWGKEWQRATFLHVLGNEISEGNAMSYNYGIFWAPNAPIVMTIIKEGLQQKNKKALYSGWLNWKKIHVNSLGALLQTPMWPYIQRRYHNLIPLWRTYALKGSGELNQFELRLIIRETEMIWPLVGDYLYRNLSVEMEDHPARFSPAERKTFQKKRAIWWKDRRPYAGIEAGLLERIELTYPTLWRNPPNLATAIFGLQVAEGLSGGKKPLTVLLDLVENSPDYWVRAYARRVAVQQIDFKKSGFKNYGTETYSLPEGKYRDKRLLWHVYGDGKSTLWFPYYSKKELNMILSVYEARLQRGRGREQLIMSDGKRGRPIDSESELEDELAEVRKRLIERNKHWNEMRRRIVPLKTTSEEFLTQLEFVFLHATRGYHPVDGRMYIPPPRRGTGL